MKVCYNPQFRADNSTILCVCVRPTAGSIQLTYVEDSWCHFFLWECGYHIHIRITHFGRGQRFSAFLHLIQNLTWLVLFAARLLLVYLFSSLMYKSPITCHNVFSKVEVPSRTFKLGIACTSYTNYCT